MIYTTIMNGVPLFCSAQHIESVAFMYKEHYQKNKMVYCINTTPFDVSEIMKSIPTGCVPVYVNLEHNCPINEIGNSPFCDMEWTDKLNESLNSFEEIWDFQIENFEYFKFHGFDKKYKFIPLRYTSWFDKYKTNEKPLYDIQMECVVDTNTRMWTLMILTQDPVRYENGKVFRSYDRIRFNMTNTFDSDVKFKAKNLCRYGFDAPHYDTPCTINCTRIYEYVCMNKPVIVWDRDKLSSHEYFKDLCVYLDDLPNTYELGIPLSRQPRTDVADAFKNMTYNDGDYDEYRLNIIREYSNKTGNKIPDSVMY